MGDSSANTISSGNIAIYPAKVDYVLRWGVNQSFAAH